MRRELSIDEAMGILYSKQRIDPKIYCEMRFIAYHAGDVEIALDMAIKALGRTRIGQWVDGRCSECHTSPLDYIESMGLGSGLHMDEPMPFCPSCGAKMEVRA